MTGNISTEATIVCPGCGDRFVAQPPVHFLDTYDGTVQCPATVNDATDV